MSRIIRELLLLIPFMVIFGCSSGTAEPPASANVSYNTAVFDPGVGDIPLPNILATATSGDPLIGRGVNKPMNPLEALAYINRHEVGNTNAVAGLNAPVYIRFQKAVDPATITAATIKVFQLGIDANGMTENNQLGFTDISAMFAYRYTPGGTDLHLYPNFPLTPGVRYLYVVTSGVKDAVTGNSLSGSFHFEALKATAPLPAAFSALEQIRDNVYLGAGKTVVALSGYAKVMDDLIAKSTVTNITSRNNIALLGRFITTGAGYILADATNAATSIPVENALRAFAAKGLPLPGVMPGVPWENDVNTTSIPPDAYWSAILKSTAVAPASVNSVITGKIRSADLLIDPVVAAAHKTTMDLTAVSGAYNPAAGVTQAFRPDGKNLAGFYYSTRDIPFVYIAPKGTPPLAGWPLVIFQHGVSGQKEHVIAVAGSLTSAGYAVVAVDLPLHGELAISGHTAWGEDFMAVGAPLALRSNIQQAAFNLNRLEFALATGGFAMLGADAPDRTTVKPTFVGFSLGSIVGAYYLAGNATLDLASAAPYSQSMKGFLSVPGGRLAYLLQTSPVFAPGVNAGLAASGIATETPAYHNFFQLTQSIVDPVDPATMTTPLTAGLPSRLSGRITVQEAVGDLYIPNESTRYFGNALGGRGMLPAPGYDVAPGFKQLAYRTGSTPNIPASLLFMYNIASGNPAPKVDFAAALNVPATTPSEGYFQFNQAGISHRFLIDPSSPANMALAQKQMVNFLLMGAVADPT